MSLRATLWAFGFVACSSTPSATESDFVSGSRLRAEVYVASNGDKQIHAIYDTELATECTFQLATDAQPRCLPVPPVFDTYYSDAQCLDMVAATSSSLPTPQYVFEDNAYYAVGTTLPATTVLFSTNGGCAPAGTADQLGVTAFTFGAPAPADAFVLASIERHARNAALEMEFFVTTDGARFPAQAFDVARHGVCATTAGHENDCAPANTATVSYLSFFSDAACTMPTNVGTPNAAPVTATHDDVATAAMSMLPDPSVPVGCGYTFAFAQIVGEWTLPLYAESPSAPTVCVAAGPSTGASLALASTPFGAADFPGILHTQPATGVGARVQTTATGERLFVEGFFDAGLGATCSGALATDGVARCFPDAPLTSFYINIAYTDDQCTLPVVSRYTDNGAIQCSAPSELRDVEARGTSIVMVGDEIAVPPSIYALAQSGKCVPFAVGDVYHSATIVPPETYPVLTDMTE